jgi:hypothetical protein
MSLVLPFLVGLLLYVAVRFALNQRAKRSPTAEADHELAGLEPWVLDVVQRALEKRLGHDTRLAQSLRGEPDTSLVSTVEEQVSKVELEFVKFAHEAAAEVYLHVVFEDGHRHTEATKRNPDELPTSVRNDFEKRGTTRAYRTWTFPWGRSYSAL